MSGLLNNVKHSIRRLVRRPTVTIVAIVALALGIGATSATFSVVRAVLLRPLPVAEPENLTYLVSTRTDRGGHYSVTYPSFVAWREAHSFSGMVAVRSRTMLLAGRDGGERIRGTEAPADYFTLLGVQPQLGRSFTEGEPGVVLISNALWHQRFGGDANILGKQLELDGESLTVIGVMPLGTHSSFLGWRDAWKPLVIDEAEALSQPLRGLIVLARLADGVSLERAQREIDTIAAKLAIETPATHQGWGVEMHSVHWWITGEVEAPIWWIFAASLLVLAVAGLTVANLLQVLATTRRQEVAVRLALGAGRAALLRDLLLDAVLLAIAGSLGGIALAVAAVDLVAPLAASELPRFDEVRIDHSVLAAAVIASIVTGVIAGLVPALTTIRNAPLTARGNRETGGQRNTRLRQGLVAFQTALAVVAMIGAGLFVRSLRQLQAVEPGFDSRNLLTARVTLPEGELEDQTARIAVLSELLQRLEAAPGITRAGTTGTRLPLTGGHGTFELFLQGHPRGPRPDVIVNAQMVSPGFRETLRIPLLRGRDFAPDETWESDNAAWVNQAFVERYWPGENPLGRWIEWSTGDRAHVAGVLGDVHQLALHLDPAPEVYLAWGSVARSQAIVLRTGLAGAGVLPILRSQVKELIPGTIVHAVATGDDLLADSLFNRQLPAKMTSILALLAQGLGSLGLYGVVAGSLRSRRREIGIRLALGAWPARMTRFLVFGGLRPVAIGLTAGLVISLATSRTLESQLYGVTATDPLTFVLAGALVLTASVIVCVLPATRAAGIAPTEALRSD